MILSHQPCVFADDQTYSPLQASAEKMADKSKGSKIPFQRILETVPGRIFAMCDTRQMCGNARVCKYWKKLSEKQDFWRLLDFSVASPLAVTDSVVISLSQRHSNVTALDLKFCTKVSNKTLQAVSLILRDLRELNLECGRKIDDKGVAVLKNCRALTSLTLDGCSRVTADGIREVLRCPELQKLSLNGLASVNDAVLDLIASTRVSYIRVNSCGNLTDLGVAAMARRQGARLRELQVAYTSVTDKSIEGVANLCPNVTELNLYGCVKITDRSLEALSLCKHLRNLDLSMCQLVTDNGVRFLVNCSQLESLQLYDCISVTVNSIIDIVRKCKKLKVLNCYGLDSLTIEQAKDILAAGPRLQRVDFGGCQQIARQDLETLSNRYRDIKI